MRNAFLCLLTLLTLSVYSQPGGKYAYSFLDLPASPRISAMGNQFLPVSDGDLNLAFGCPSLISAEMDYKIALNFVDFYAGITGGNVAFSRTYSKLGSYVAGMHFMNYGKFRRTDALGNELGSFTAGDYAFYLGWGRALSEKTRLGSNLKMIYSDYDTYNSFGIAVDVAASWSEPKKGLVFTAQARNIGLQVKPYREDNREPLPFQLQAGLSKKLENAPFRFVFMLNHLQKWDITWEDPLNPTLTVDPLTSEPLPEKKLSKFADKAARHLVAGAEFVPSKNFHATLAYNYQRRKDLQVATKTGLTGFSWGFGFRIKKMTFDFARANYHLSGAPNHIGITYNLKLSEH